MSNGDLLHIEPIELQFPFELKKQISCSMQLSNKSGNYVAFKVKTTNPKKYCVRPNTGVVVPHSSCEVIVTMQAQKEAPPDLQCRDKFLLQSVVVSPDITPKDITPEMFTKESGNQVDECKLKVSYVPPPQPPSPVREGSEEGSSPRASVSDNGTVNQTSEFMSKAFVQPQESTSEEEIRNSPSNLPINQPNPNESLIPAVRGINDLPKPPVANRPPEKRQRVPSAYNRFIKDEIQRIKAGNPDISHREAFSAALKNWAHFPHIHFGLMPDQSVKKQEGDDVLMKEGFNLAHANVGLSPY